jgi:hypothetical protein
LGLGKRPKTRDQRPGKERPETGEGKLKTEMGERLGTWGGAEEVKRLKRSKG